MSRTVRTDIVLAAVITAFFQAEIWFLVDVGGSRALISVMALAITAPVALRRRAPLTAVTIVAVAYLIMLQAFGMSANTYLSIVVVLLLMAYSSGNHPDRRLAVVGGVVALGATFLELIWDGSAADEYLFILLLVGSAWAAGLAVRERERRATTLQHETVQLRQQRDQAATTAAVAERARIARELHDIISHSVSVMVLQAGAAGEVVATDPDRARRSLDAIQHTGREALVELRRLLGVLSEEHTFDSLAPQPSVARLDGLVQTMTKAGLQVDVRVVGAPRPLPPGLDVSSFRIVQEALTNAARHAGPVPVEVILSYQDDAFDIQVIDRGPRVSGALLEGRGLVGMRERVALHVGQLDAGPRPAGGFAVHARLPLTPATT